MPDPHNISFDEMADTVGGDAERQKKFLGLQPVDCNSRYTCHKVCRLAPFVVNSGAVGPWAVRHVHDDYIGVFDWSDHEPNQLHTILERAGYAVERLSNTGVLRSVNDPENPATSFVEEAFPDGHYYQYEFGTEKTRRQRSLRRVLEGET